MKLEVTADNYGTGADKMKEISLGYSSIKVNPKLHEGDWMEELPKILNDLQLTEFERGVFLNHCNKLNEKRYRETDIKDVERAIKNTYLGGKYEEKGISISQFIETGYNQLRKLKKGLTILGVVMTSGILLSLLYYFV